MTKKLTPKDAYKLFHEGTTALADVEANGFRIDVDKLDKTIEKVKARIHRNIERLKEDEVWEVWEKTFGRKANIGSRVQLGTVLFDKMEYESVGKTAKGTRNRTDEEALESLDIPFVKKYLAMGKLKQLHSTYLKKLRSEVVGEYVHAVYNLNLAISFRSSCDSPNIQNQVVREPGTAELIRSCFIARENHQILEIDYSALEFKIAACFWRDKNLVDYASDPEKDVHRDMAMECYMLTKDEVTKESRFYAKNKFVFPQLYGSNHKPCARNLWFAIQEGNLKTQDGVGLRKHLKKLADIKKLGLCKKDVKPLPGTFEWRIEKVEKKFNGWFPEFSKRKEDWWNRYQERGKFRLMTGFDVKGIYTRNQLYNIPIQGPAFHCLLWALIRLNGWLRENKMRSVIVGTIHDSILFDAHKDELEDVMRMSRKIMTDEIRNVWKWIIVPLEVEFEASPVNGSWWEKKEVKI